MDKEFEQAEGPDDRRVKLGSEARSLVDRLRMLEADHEPDGWPAVQLRDITALCSEIDRLRSVALQHISHSYEGGCPDDLDQMLRDPNCPACQVLGPNAKDIRT